MEIKQVQDFIKAALMADIPGMQYVKEALRDVKDEKGQDANKSHLAERLECVQRLKTIALAMGDANVNNHLLVELREVVKLNTPPGQGERGVRTSLALPGRAFFLCTCPCRKNRLAFDC